MAGYQFKGPSFDPNAKQTAVVLRNQGPEYFFEQQLIDIPKPGPNEVLVRIYAVGICGTDTGLAQGHLGPCHESHILGHEGIGHIIQLGSAVKETATVKPGSRVGVGWIRGVCHSCPACLSGRGEIYCQNKTWSGVHVSGTLARFITVPESYLVLLTDDIMPEEQAPIMCAGVTAYTAIKKANAVPGSWMLISGAAGNVGSLGVQYAKAMGYRVIAVDGGNDKYKQQCLDKGAEAYVDFRHGKPKDAVHEITKGELVATAIVCSAASQAYDAALECVAMFGTLVCVGIPAPHSTMSLHPLKLINDDIKILGSFVGSRGDILEAMEFVRRGLVTPTILGIASQELNDWVRKIPELGSKLIVLFED